MGKVTQIDGLAVKDGKVPISLHILRQDILTANLKAPDQCAVAKACYREIKAEKVRVHLSRVYVKMPGKRQWLRFMTPKSLRQEIIAFDRGGSFAPGEYTLGVPVGSRTLTGTTRGAPQSSSTAGRNKTGRRRKYHVVHDVRAAAGQ